MTTRQFTQEEARAIGERIGIDWAAGDVDLEQFRMGLAVELEHGSQDPATDVTHDDEIITGKIALAHLREISDYYTRLAAMEQDAEGSPALSHAHVEWNGMIRGDHRPVGRRHRRDSLRKS